MNGLSEMADFTFTTKYARYDEAKKRRETWNETVSRVEKMHLKRFSYLPAEDKEEIKEAFNLVREKEVVPSMRSMQFGGKAIEAHHMRIYNCLDKNTTFITSSGVKSFNDYKDGDSITVLTHKGRWKKAIVRNYGQDYLYPITIKRSKNTQIVWATKNHRWLLKDESVTDSLEVGQILRGAADIFSGFSYENATPEEKLYWAYGYVYGDGTLVSSGNNKYSMVRLCKKDANYHKRFEELGFKTSTSLSCDGDFMAYTGRYLKTAPNPSVDSPNLIKAFVAGYCDADAYKRHANKETPGNKYYDIQSSDPEHIAFIRACFPIAGIYLVSEKDITGEVTNYGTRPFTIKFRLVNSLNNKVNSNTPFVVSEIGEPRLDQVWCLEVEEDQSFTLPNGLVTGNCAVTHIHSIRSFAESFYSLLCGNGIGFGLTERFLNRLPDLVNAKDKTGTVITYTVQDNIEGWADSVEALLNCYFKNTAYTGRKIVFDYSKIRPRGAKLKTGGGKAPGYKGLKNCHSKIKALLDRIIEEKGQKRLRPIDAYDILMHTADAVLSGGIRRSACSVIFDANDTEMMNAKTGNWFNENPQRARSNNSAIIIRGKTSFEDFKTLINKTKEFGEPGFLYVVDDQQLLNPCFEISFIPVTVDGRCGFQMCNLSSINGAKINTLAKFRRAAKAAALIGTLQASYTDFPYLGHTSEELTKAEALLGVSITGLMDNPDILLNAENQKECAKIAVETNKIWAQKIGIKQAARVTCVKPEGTSSIVLGSSSGIHPHHARKYFRRIQVNKDDNVYNFFKIYNPHAVEPSVWSANKTDDVITFPIEVSPNAIVKEQLTALQHLEIIKSTQLNWVNTGTTEANTKPLDHSVSCTVMVKDHEWEEVTKYLFDNQKYFTAVSLLPATGDKIYQQAPMEAVVTPEDEAKWNNLVSQWESVDYSKLEETDDETSHLAEAACAGGKCETTKL